MKIAFLFPGQGAQYAGMGKDLYDHSPEARRIFEEADTILNFPLSKMCFEGPFDELTKTQNCQPAVLVTSMAVLYVFRKNFPQLIPSYVAGLSLGEYSALAASEIINFHDAVHLVRKRGEFMEAAAAKNPGKMSCILGLDVELVREICQETGCEIANLNCPGQVVVSGRLQNLEALSKVAAGRGAKRVIPLDVSGAFHSSLMKEAAGKLKTEIEKITFHKPLYPLISNVDACEQTDPNVIKVNLIKQVDSATYWEASMKYLLSKGVDTFFEIGPGSVLKGLFKKIEASARVASIGKWPDIQEAATSIA